ncbi:MAG: FAD-dependent oxidoreductase [Actinobacteria bacterium]|nr:FAD-dependent oxidoreductase [Actinomycetota bacterium]
MVEERDVVIIGAGIAGMTAAKRLRHHDPLVLEASDRVGGRIWSRPCGELAMSVGAHMFPPPDSTVGRMVAEYGLDVLPITGSMLNVAWGDRVYRDMRPELLPLRLPLAPAARVSFARAGLKVKRIGDAYMRLAEQRPGETAADVRLRLLQYGGDETFADFLGPLHPEAQRIFTALCNRTIADPHEISVSAMAALFGHVWDSGDLGRNMRGGAGLLPEAMGADLAGHIRLRTRAVDIAFDGAGVTVTAEGPEGPLTVRARTAICAVPAPDLMPVIQRAATPGLQAALDRVRFGPHVVVSIRTDETEPMPWDDIYSVLTPDYAFNMLFNHTNSLYATGTRKTGSVLMVYGGASRGTPLLDRPHDEIAALYLADLYRLYPEARGHVAETWVMPWAHAGPFAAPGRWRAQEALERGLGGRVFLAGDWVSDFVSMETAALTAVDAADRVEQVLMRTGAIPAAAPA